MVFVTWLAIACAESVKDVANNQEIAWHGDAIHGQWSPFLGNSQPYEYIQQSYLQEEIKEMGTGKADAILFVRFLSEGEMSGQQVVEAETDDVADGIGNTLVHERQQYQIDGVVDGYGNDANYPKTE